MATYTITTTLLNNNSLFDVLLKGGSGSGLSTFNITNSDGTVTTFTGSNLTWNGTTATAGTVTSIVRKSADGTVTYDQITGFTGANDSFTNIWNPGGAGAGAGQAARAGFIFSGADTVNGSSSNDSTLRGYNGVDTFNGGAGNDAVAYDNDTAAGGAGAIIVNMSASAQMTVAANSARDGFGTIDSLTSIEEARGSANADFFFGSTSYNLFAGRQGADTYDGGNTVAFFKGFAPTLWNWVDYRLENTLGGSTSGITITLTNGTATPGTDGVGDTGGSGTDTFGAAETFTNINAIRGSGGAGVTDTVNGNGFANAFEGLAGVDVFDGNGGLDRYQYNNEFRFGGSTTRGVSVNLSDSAVMVGAVNVAAHTGIDTFNGAIGFVDQLIDVEDIFATNQADTIHGSQFDNRFYLFDGNDVAFLGEGFDYVEPGAGNDIIHGEAGAGLDQSYADRDEISYDDFGANGIGVYIDLNLGTLVDPTGGTDTIFDIERLRGTSSADTLIGSDTANLREEFYRGLGGNDVIDGRNGYDAVDYSQDANNGGAGGIIANLSTAAITVGAFTVQGGTVRDGFGSTDTLYYIEGVRGTAGDDTMVGNAGNNQFRGMGGTDTIDGGDGIDQLELFFGDVFTGLGGIVNLAATDFAFGGHTVASNTARQFDGGIATLTSIEVVSGSSANDGLNGSEARDQLNGLFGDDTIFGNGGNDVINGHQGANTLDGGDGFDTVSFMYDKTQGDYHVESFPGNGFVVWGGVTVNLGTNSATGFDGQANVITNFEAVTGTFVNDNITGNGLDNSFRGLSGDDTIDGAGGNDTINYSPTNQDGRILVPIVGVNYSEPNVVRVNLTTGALTLGGAVVAAGKALDGEGGTDTLISIENVTGSIGADFIAASLVSNVIDGGNADDTVVYAGVQGDYEITTVNGGWQVVRNAVPTDIDVLRNVETLAFTGGGTMSLAVQGLSETGDGTDNEIVGVQGGDTLDGGGGADFIDGGEGSDEIEGGNGADELVGGDGDDVVDGGEGDDTLVGGSGEGDDTYIGGSGTDTAVYTSASLGIVVDLDVPGNPGSGTGTATGTEIGTDQLTGIENVVGGQGADSITGDSQANNLQGVAGADQILGEGGIDTLQGGSGNDTLEGGADNDFLYGDSDDDTLKGGAGTDLIDGGANSLVGGDTADFSDATGSVVATLGADGDAVVTAAGIGTDTLVRIENLTGGVSGDTLIGNAAANDLNGGGGNDILDGGVGDDDLNGGSGDDIHIVDSAADAVFETVGNGTDRVLAGVSYALAAGQSIETLDVVDSGGMQAINLTGNELVNNVMGNAGNNILDGGGGSDAMRGFGGDDIYYVDGSSDQVFESGGAGNDRILAGVSYTLAAGQSIETLDVVNSGGMQAINLTANELVNNVMGNAGNNILDGGGAADEMRGFGGDDTYFVDVAGDQVFEAGGAGDDRVLANVSYTLAAGQSIETLDVVSSGGTTAINLTGNEIVNTVLGNAGNNVLDGGGASDVIRGFGGDDIYYVDNNGDLVFESAGAGNDRVLSNVNYTLTAGQAIETLDVVDSGGMAGINLIGNELANKVVGNAGSNVIGGRAGNDVLTGLGGMDMFLFDSNPSGGIDTITDFNVADDSFLLNDGDFGGLPQGVLAASAFVIGSAAGTANHRIVYNDTTGAVFFDADGTGSTAAIQFATVGTGLALANTHFFVL